MIVQRNGVPHRVRFDWRGAFFWMAQIAMLAALVGIVK